MGAKLGKKKSAAYAERIVREREERLAAEREATFHAAREREQQLVDARQRYENHIREEELKRTREAEARQAKQREAELERERQKMAQFKEREQRVANVQTAIEQLSEGEPDLSSPEAARAAAERAATVLGLQQLLQKADAALRQAERAIGRHRTGS